MAAKDAGIQPIYACKFRDSVSLVDSDAAPIALADGDTEKSLDSAAFVAATNELTAKTGNPVGECYIDFTYAEMTAKEVRVVPKSTGAVTRGYSLFPQRLPVLRSGTAQAGAAATMTLDSGASAKDGAYVGCLLRCSNNTPAGVQGDVSKIIGYVGETKVATVADAWTDTPTSSTTFEILVPSDLSISTLLATAAEVVTALEATALEGTITWKQAMMLAIARFGGIATGGGTTEIIFKNPAGTKSRVTLTVDASGNVSASSFDFS